MTPSGIEPMIWRGGGIIKTTDCTFHASPMENLFKKITMYQISADKFTGAPALQYIFMNFCKIKSAVTCQLAAMCA
jgi:hypothetical protein